MDIVTCGTEKSKKKETGKSEEGRARNRRGVSRLLPLAKCRQKRLLQYKLKVIKNNPRSQLTAPGISYIQLYKFLSNSIVFWTHLKNCFFSLHHDPVFWTHPKNQLTYLNFNS